MPDSILITGAASGIGLAAAQLFHSKGWRVGLLDINARDLARIAGGLRDQQGQPAWHRAVDVTDATSAQAAVDDFAGKGGLRVLFNCAGVLRTGHFAEVPLAEHELTLRINVLGTMIMARAALPWLKQAHRPVMINMSSASAVYGIPHLASYSASKFAVRALTEALHIEWKPLGVHVCDLMPPFVRTPMLASQQFIPPVLRKLGVNMAPEKVAQAALNAVERRAVHHPIGLQFNGLVALEKLTPRRVTQRLIGWLSQ